MHLGTLSSFQGHFGLRARTARGHALPRLAPHRQLCTPLQSSNSQASPEDLNNIPDPEAKFRRYGKHFGGGYKLEKDWLQDAPQVRFRDSRQRQRDELLELAVLNERLAGAQPWEARRKLEYIKMRRKNWEHIYDYVTKTEAAATLALIEEANREAELVLSEERREQTSVSDLKQKLVTLQEQVDEAHQRLHLTQARVEQNLQRVNELKSEAVSLEQTQRGTVAALGRLRPLVQERSQAKALPPAAAGAAGSRRAPASAGGAAGLSAKERGLQSTLEIEEGLKNFWYPVEFSSKLVKDKMVPFEMMEMPWVMFRDASGKASCIHDQCAHRACPLSLGKVVDGQVQCPYHGWEFSGSGECTKMPSTRLCRNIRVSALPTAERHGFVWVWPGDEEPSDIPDFAVVPDGYLVHAELVLDVPVEHGLLMENLLDLAHAPFTHTSTFAKGWPVPDFVRFQAGQLLSGNWDPYPIDMAFQPPCMVLSTIGLAQPGKIMRGVRAGNCGKHLHQLHVCLPSAKGRTRLLYRMSLDFMPWARGLPLIGDLWQQVAAQVLSEDLCLVAGQQDRLQRGGNTWANPVSYDKLAVRYRRWRNTVAASAYGGASAAAEEGSDVGGMAMSAGELFAIDQDGFVDEMGQNAASQPSQVAH